MKWEKLGTEVPIGVHGQSSGRESGGRQKLEQNVTY